MEEQSAESPVKRKRGERGPGIKKRNTNYNEKGEKLTKKGLVDKRVKQGLINLQKSKIFQAIQEAKKERKKKLETIIDDSESEPENEPDSEPDELVVEEYIVKKKNEPQVVEKIVEVEKPVEKVIEKIVEKQIDNPQLIKQVEHLKQNNKTLRRNFVLQKHLEEMEFRTKSLKKR